MKNKCEVFRSQRLVCKEVLKFLVANGAVHDVTVPKTADTHSKTCVIEKAKTRTRTTKTSIASDLNSLKLSPETVLINRQHSTECEEAWPENKG